MSAAIAEVAGERLSLLPERAAYWERMTTLFVADPHFGKAAAFRAAGVLVPRGTTSETLARLDRCLAQTDASRIVFLGDFLHAKEGRSPETFRTINEWRERRSSVETILVRGNHDARAGDPPANWQIRCVDEPFALPPFIACHMTDAPPSGYALCGHLHPGVRIHGAAEQSAWLPCFVLGERRAILPAFGRFTGLAAITRAPDERIVAIAGRTLFALPSSAG